MSLLRNMSKSAGLLGLFAIIGTTLVALTFDNTAQRIAANEREFLLNSLHTLITPAMHDNDMFLDVIQVTDKAMLGSKKPVNIYRARKDGKNVAAIINAVAPDGYNGNIELLVAIDHTGKLIGVRVTKHKETPGLGDAIDISKSDWILGFSGKSLDNTAKREWRVKRDGGIFDQFTGATITPRAVVKAVHNALQYFKLHQAMIFERPAMKLTDQQIDLIG
ncbi:MAG: electron transport complex subunit RsxG [Thioalkalispiraceae bacterium]|jgi:electron transport complex protein RnfG